MEKLITFIDNSGRKREGYKRTCPICNNEFNASLRFAKNGEAKYCSKICLGVSSRKPKVKHICSNSNCNKEFERSKPKSGENTSKHLKFFCSRKCKDEAQRIGGVKEIQPPHYGKDNPKKDYRILAFRHKKPECEECGYNKYKEVLDVHHVDKNRTNNNINNLKILCPTCHREEHFLNG